MMKFIDDLAHVDRASRGKIKKKTQQNVAVVFTVSDQGFAYN